MNRLEQRFADLKAKGETAFIPYITAGDPTLKHTEDLVLAFEKAGADLVELGVPFSDPLADGPVNQEAAMRALKHDVTLEDILAMVKRVRKTSELPLLLFTYYNPVLAYGEEKLAKDAKEAGIDGILCVDLPPEEGEALIGAFREAGLDTVFLLAPTSTPDRIDLVTKHSTGFIYYVSRTGTTGMQDHIEASVKDMVATIKSKTDIPVAIGFGISNPDQAAEVAGYGDGVVVGSAIVRRIGELGDAPDMVQKVAAFVRTLASGAKGGPVSA
jgi:tryptophan synthase alpha chain